jgi:inner membrane protein
LANASQHAVIGGMAGGSTYVAMCSYYKRQARLDELLICIGVGVATAAVPDLLEPALHPHHRQIAHSFTTGGVLAKLATEKCFTNCEWDQLQKIVLAAAIAGYLSHLVADACTPRCLPII